VLGNRRMDCSGRVVTRPSDWEYRESTIPQPLDRKGSGRVQREAAEIQRGKIEHQIRQRTAL
jgi:hypothetical protein